MITHRSGLPRKMGLLLHEAFFGGPHTDQITMKLSHREPGFEVEVPLIIGAIIWGSKDPMGTWPIKVDLTDGDLFSVSLNLPIERFPTAKEALAEDISKMSEVEAAEMRGYLAKMREKS